MARTNLFVNQRRAKTFILFVMGEIGMKQPHTESTVQHTDDQQNIGNHKKPGAPDAHGADKFGGTRTGAENIEKPHRDDVRKNAPD